MWGREQGVELQALLVLAVINHRLYLEDTPEHRKYKYRSRDGTHQLENTSDDLHPFSQIKETDQNRGQQHLHRKVGQSVTILPTLIQQLQCFCSPN